ncbi:MAG: radical SAM protein [Candidatus Aenigmarchaeota archaeon]|nr:radical SAM protein [Candidatus Aenigmarchaeota archaeon]
MKTLLVNPQLKKYQQPSLPPLGLLSIAAVLEKEGQKVDLLDLNVEPKALKNYKEKPDLVGITATTPLVKEAWNLTKYFRKKRIPVILGGPHPSALPEESLKYADIVIRNEGELTMKKLCENWDKKEKVIGISYKKNGKIIHNPPRPLIKNLDELPFPAYHLLPDISLYSTPQPVVTQKKRCLTLVTSRGCPYQCNYCFKGVFGPVWRPHSAEYIVRLWKYLVSDFGVEEIGVQDDNFNFDYDRARRIVDGLIKEKINIPWTTAQGIRADKVDLPLLSKMKKSGFFRTGFGIEAGSQEMIYKIGKGLKLEKAEKAIKICKKLGIESIGYFIIGNAYDNTKTMEETINLAIKLDPDIAHFTIAVPLPSTPLYKLIEKEGKFLIKDWNLYGYTRGLCYFEVGELKKELVETMYRRAYRRFYLRPKVVKRILTKKSTWLRIPEVARASVHYLGGRNG